MLPLQVSSSSNHCRIVRTIFEWRDEQRNPLSSTAFCQCCPQAPVGGNPSAQQKLLRTVLLNSPHRFANQHVDDRELESTGNSCVIRLVPLHLCLVDRIQHG